MTDKDAGNSDGYGSWGSLEWHDPDDIEDPVTIAEIDEDIEPAAPRRRRGLKFFGALAAIGTVTLIANNTEVERKDGFTSIRIFSPSPDSISDPAELACPAVPPAEMRDVKILLRKPENPDIGAIYKKYEPGDKIILSATKEYRKLANQAAAANSLTLVDERPFWDQLQEAQNPLEMLTIINSFTKNYGFQVTVYQEQNTDDNLFPLHFNELSNLQFYTVLNNILDTFRYLPVEEVKATGLRKLRLVRAFRSPDGSVAEIDGQANSDGLVDIGMKAMRLNAAPVIYHELGHLIDREYCGPFGFAYYDPVYEDLNPDDFVGYGTGLYWKNATISQYGSSNIQEDKAEIYTNMLGGLEEDGAHSSYRAVREKYALLLARLSIQAPGTAEYLADISPRR